MSIADAVVTDLRETVSICSLRVGANSFGIDTRQIREVLGTTVPQSVPLSAEYIAGVVPYRGEVLTTVSFRALLGLENKTGKNCVLVFEDEQNEEHFGLLVDSVNGVIAIESDALQANPSGLDARSMELFDGAYRMQSGLIVRLDPQRLRPSQLAQSELFGTSKHQIQGEQR